jgi:hypothetical protein
MDPTYGNAAPAATFTVPGAFISVDPQDGGPGSAVTITGSGFTGYTPIQITIGGFPVPTIVLTSPLGDFTLAASVPGVQPGSRVVAAESGVSTLATTFFVVTQAPETVKTALASIMDQLVIVWGFVDGEWLFYDPADAAGSDLGGLVKGSGYWVNVSAAVDLIFGGNSYSLADGWNNIGWLGK